MGRDGVGLREGAAGLAELDGHPAPARGGFGIGAPAPAPAQIRLDVPHDRPTRTRLTCVDHAVQMINEWLTLSPGIGGSLRLILLTLASPPAPIGHGGRYEALQLQSGAEPAPGARFSRRERRLDPARRGRPRQARA